MDNSTVRQQVIQREGTIPEKMRAAVLFGPRDIRVVERPVPAPAYGEVLVKVALS